MRTLVLLALFVGRAAALLAAQTESAKPNIVVILADDLGYADTGCYGGKIQTPQIDRLAAEGMRFTDAHSTSSVCTPTRYGLLTGRYNWRSRLQSGVLGGLSPRLIEPGRITIATLLKQHGYHTACVGKWHLGMDWAVRPGGDVAELSIERREQVFNVDYAEPIANGPNSVGFDYYYGISASLDMVPYTFIENDRVVSLPTDDRDFPMMHDRQPERRTRKGPAAPDFDAANVLPVIARKSVEYIDQRAAEQGEGQPFFLYVALASPHTPILPTAKWQGRSAINPYADFVMESDWAVGEILAALDRHELADRTLVVFTSDNGCSPQARFDELAAKGHRPSGPLRGHKADLFEGGHRIPLVARWPGTIPAGAKCEQLICQTDLLATIAEILEAELPHDSGEDSISFLGTLTNAGASERDHLVSHSVNGSFAIRRGPWKLLLCADSGGWSAPRPGSQQAEGLPPVQLYDLDNDLGEETNLADRHPEKVGELMRLLEQIVARGRSTPGAEQRNEVPINLRAGDALEHAGYAATASGVLPTADGFRGIWYANQPSGDEFVFKYSGGMATYPQQHHPIAIYAPEVQKTFFVYGGRYKNRNTLLHMVSYYDHRTGQVARPRVLLDKRTDDAHDNPTLSIDSDGYLYIFSSAHGTSRPAYVHRSQKPYDIAAFDHLWTTNFSYPQPWFLKEHGFVFLHTRYIKGRALHVMQSSDGTEWTKPVLLARVGEGHYQVSQPFRNTIGTAFNYHPAGKGLNFRTNIYYMQSSDGGRTWTNARGERLTLPLTEVNNPALAVEYESRKRLCYLKCLAFTNDGRPVVLFLTSGGYKSGPANGPRTFTTAEWTGSEWRVHEAMAGDNNYDFAELEIRDDGVWQLTGATEQGPQAYNPGGELAIWHSSDQGATWRKHVQLTRDSKLNHTFPRRPLNAQDDFYVIWADGHAREMSDSSLYFANRDGTAVYKLPPTIDRNAQLVRPILVSGLSARER